MDLTGPWKIKVNRVQLEFNTLTCTDPVTNPTETVRKKNETSKNIANQFSNCWLAQHPRPTECIHDNGREFTGHKFRALLNQAGIKSKPTTAKNPQANAVCERMHKTVADIVRTLVKEKPPSDDEEAEECMDNAMGSCIHALRCVVNHTMKTSPGALVFQSDMLMDVPLVADLEAIRGRQQQWIDDHLRRTNKGRVDCNCHAGEKVKLQGWDPVKLEGRFRGQCENKQVFTNGTVKLQLEPEVQRAFNTRKMQPIR